jgi:CubicO group peptidase (beta-lactamase class C family)
VSRGDTVLLHKAYGVIGATPVRPNSKFWIASAGKQFTSAAVLKCADQGWLSLDDPLSKFFANAPDDKRAITIRQLLAHLSGLDQTYASEGASDRDDALKRMFAHPLIDLPGHKFHYSNDNYQTAAAIVEVASGISYQAFVRNELLRPAGMRATGFAGRPGASGVLPARAATPARLAAESSGMEGVYSSAGDLLTWYRALHSARILSHGSEQLLFTPVATIQEGQTALGWFVGRTDGGVTRIFTRGNEDWGPNSLLYAYPESGFVIIVLTHAGDAEDGVSWSRFIHSKLERTIFP